MPTGYPTDNIFAETSRGEDSPYVVDNLYSGLRVMFNDSMASFVFNKGGDYSRWNNPSLVPSEREERMRQYLDDELLPAYRVRPTQVVDPNYAGIINIDWEQGWRDQMVVDNKITNPDPANVIAYDLMLADAIAMVAYLRTQRPNALISFYNVPPIQRVNDTVFYDAVTAMISLIDVLDVYSLAMYYQSTRIISDNYYSRAIGTALALSRYDIWPNGQTTPGATSGAFKPVTLHMQSREAGGLPPNLIDEETFKAWYGYGWNINYNGHKVDAATTWGADRYRIKTLDQQSQDIQDVFGPSGEGWVGGETDAEIDVWLDVKMPEIFSWIRDIIDPSNGGIWQYTSSYASETSTIRNLYYSGDPPGDPKTYSVRLCYEMGEEFVTGDGGDSTRWNALGGYGTREEFVSAEGLTQDSFISEPSFSGLILIRWDSVTDTLNGLVGGEAAYQATVADMIALADYVRLQRPLAQVSFYNVPNRAGATQDFFWHRIAKHMGAGLFAAFDFMAPGMLLEHNDQRTTEAGSKKTLDAHILLANDLAFPEYIQLDLDPATDPGRDLVGEHKGCFCVWSNRYDVNATEPDLIPTDQFYRWFGTTGPHWGCGGHHYVDPDATTSEVNENYSIDGYILRMEDRRLIRTAWLPAGFPDPEGNRGTGSGPPYEYTGTVWDRIRTAYGADGFSWNSTHADIDAFLNATLPQYYQWLEASQLTA